MKGGYVAKDRGRGNEKKLSSNKRKRARTSKLVNKLHSISRRTRRSRRSRGRK